MAMLAPAADRPFLDMLDTSASETLERCGMQRRYPPRAALFHESQLGDRVYIVLAGRVKLTRVSDEGREIMLAVRGRGDLIGEMSAIDGHPRAATVTALEEVNALVIGARDFLAVVEAHPPVAVALVKMISKRLREADRMHMEFASHDTMGRVAARIIELAERFGVDSASGTRIDLPISQEELAGWVGCSREGVSRALQAMRDLGWVKTERRRIIAYDVEALRARAAVE